MNPFVSRRAALAFTLLYITLGVIHSFLNGNAEFLRYLIILLTGAVFIAIYRNWLPLPAWLLWLVSIAGLLHLLGGSVIVSGDVLYAYVPVVIQNPFGLTVLKYDQVVHLFGSAVAALVIFGFLRGARHVSGLTLGLITFLAAVGVGALNEIIELHVKLTVPQEGVGGYYNNALDLVFNTIGAGIAAVLAMRFWGRENLQGK